MPKVRTALQYLEGVFDSPHPLLTEKMLTDGVSVIVEKSSEVLIDASMKGQVVMREVLEAHLQRIEQDFDGLPADFSRLYATIHMEWIGLPTDL